MVVALGVTTKGDKVFLGFVQTDTENAVVIRSFLRSLKDRGLDLSAGALVVIDGARGLRSGVLAVFKGQVLIQRCQWHKRKNVISYLPRAEQKGWRQRLQRASELRVGTGVHGATDDGNADSRVYGQGCFCHGLGPSRHNTTTRATTSPV